MNTGGKNVYTDKKVYNKETGKLRGNFICNEPNSRVSVFVPKELRANEGPHGRAVVSLFKPLIEIK